MKKKIKTAIVRRRKKSKKEQEVAWFEIRALPTNQDIYSLTNISIQFRLRLKMNKNKLSNKYKKIKDRIRETWLIANEIYQNL